MTDLRSAAQQALEALENARDTTYSDTLYAQFEVSINALKAALEQPEHEPVAIALHTGTKQGIKWICRVDDGVPLFTHPPRREWRGLTDKEMEDVWMRSPQSPSMRECLQTYARAIEAKLKERNA